MADLRFESTTTWHDFSIGNGLDHRVVHCQFHMSRKLLAKQSNINFESMESCLHIAATSGGSCSRARARFQPSPELRDLRVCADSSTRKELSLCISRLHCAEMRQSQNRPSASLHRGGARLTSSPMIWKVSSTLHDNDVPSSWRRTIFSMLKNIQKRG